MNTFTNLLNEFIKDKHISINELIRYLNIDRSTMYKILKGQRKPSHVNIVHKIASYLRLNQVQKNNLLDAYYIATEGEYIYFGRKHVETFLASFSFHMNTNLLHNQNILLPPPLSKLTTLHLLVINTM